MHDVSFFRSADELRRWFRHHHRTARELWVGFYKKGSGKASITWPESVREALCFGWIDGVRKSIDEESYRIRFTPRRPTSNWSRVNVGLARQLIEEGRMEPSGLEAFRARSDLRSGVYSYEQAEVALEPGFERELKRNRAAWRFFQAQAPWYRRTASRWIMSAKREETRLRRLRILIADSEKGRTIAPLRRPTKKK